MMLKKSVLMAGLLAASLLIGCESKEATPPSVSVANPASAYCVKQGGKLEIVKDEAGEKGMCHLPDGTVIDEWELFRRDN